MDGETVGVIVAGLVAVVGGVGFLWNKIDKVAENASRSRHDLASVITQKFMAEAEYRERQIAALESRMWRELDRRIREIGNC